MTAAFAGAAEHIWQAVFPTLPHFSVEVVAEIDSTNSELMRRSRNGIKDSMLLIAERQSAGRGRLGRVWVSESAVQPLTFSIGLSLSRADWSGLSLVVGMAVAQALRGLLPVAVAADVGIKWPNDIWWQGRKLAGMLIETTGQTVPRYAVIGIGINAVSPRLPQLPPLNAIGQPAPVQPVGWGELGLALSAGQVLQTVAPAVIAAVLAFDQTGCPQLAEQFAAFDLLNGQAVCLTPSLPARKVTEGTAHGIDASGALRVQTGAEWHTVTSGEVSVRPALGYPHAL